MLRQKARAVAAAAVATLVALTVGAASSSAKAPASFYGVVPQTNLAGADFERMGQGKVGTLRTILTWSAIDPTAAADDNDWSSFDPIVLNAAQNGIEVLPFVYGTPTWVASGIDGNKCSAKCVYFPPKSAAALAAWKTFVGDAIDRYGPNGEFWTLHPEVTKDPIGTWQIWNEQNSETFYAPKPSAKGYAKMLAAASEAIDAHDPTAEIVLGGMAELAGSHKAIPGSEYLTELYRVKGASQSFDGVAPHPYGATIGKISAQVESYRKVMKQAGDSGAGMWITEIGAGSASGGNSLNRGTQGQASLLKEIYKYFLKQRNKMNIETVDWFSWMDSKQNICSWCASSGLLKKNGKAKPSYKAFTKLTGGSPGKR
jgi:hypothetical protein